MIDIPRTLRAFTELRNRLPVEGWVTRAPRPSSVAHDAVLKFSIFLVVIHNALRILAFTRNEVDRCRELAKLQSDFERPSPRSAGTLNWAAAIRPIPSTGSSEAPRRSGAAFARSILVLVHGEPCSIVPGAVSSLRIEDRGTWGQSVCLAWLSPLWRLARGHRWFSLTAGDGVVCRWR